MLKEVLVWVEASLREVTVDDPSLTLLGDHEPKDSAAFVLRHLRHIGVERELILALPDELVELRPIR